MAWAVCHTFDISMCHEFGHWSCQVLWAFCTWSIRTSYLERLLFWAHSPHKKRLCEKETVPKTCYVPLKQVEGFWGCYCHLARPSTLPNPTDIHLFKEGIRPLWEVFACKPNLFFQHPPDECGKEHLFKWQSSSQCAVLLSSMWMSIL
jgi:hypothetical protein